MSKDQKVEQRSNYLAVNVLFAESIGRLDKGVVYKDSKLGFKNKHQYIKFSSLRDLKVGLERVLSPFDCAICVDVVDTRKHADNKLTVDAVNDMISNQVGVLLAEVSDAYGTGNTADLSSKVDNLQKQLDKYKGVDVDAMQRELDELRALKVDDKKEPSLFDDVDLRSKEGKAVLEEAKEVLKANDYDFEDYSNADIIKTARELKGGE